MKIKKINKGTKTIEMMREKKSNDGKQQQIKEIIKVSTTEFFVEESGLKM